MNEITKLSAATSWLEDIWVSNLAAYSRTFRSQLPFTFSVAKDKKTAKFEMALAGYANSDLDVSYSNEGVLSIKTKKTNSDDELMEYVHKGIANRFFQFAMPIFSSYIIKYAILKDGLLQISFERLPSHSTRVEVRSS